MKYFILLNPISNASTGIRGLFAQPCTFDKAQVLEEFKKQDLVRIFTDEQQAFRYAKSIDLKPSRPPKADGEVALILSAELAIKPVGEEKQETKVIWNPDNEPKDPYPVKINFVFQLVQANSIPLNALQDAKFSDRRELTVDLRESSGVIASLKNIFSKMG